MICPVECSKCKYRRMKDGRNYCVLYQSLCRRVYGYCRRASWDGGLRVNRISRI